MPGAGGCQEPRDGGQLYGVEELLECQLGKPAQFHVGVLYVVKICASMSGKSASGATSREAVGGSVGFAGLKTFLSSWYSLLFGVQ